MYSIPTFYYYYPQYETIYLEPSIMMPVFEQPANFQFLSWNTVDESNRNLNGNQFFSIIDEPKIEQTPPTIKLQPEVDESAKAAQKKKQLRDLATSKKNGESNIINRFFTFFQNQQKSKPILMQIVNKVSLKNTETTEKVVQTFYIIIALLSTTQKRTYVNRKNIIDLTMPIRLMDRLYTLWPDFEQEIQVSLDTMSKVFRFCINTFIKKWSLLSILNSRRISITSKKQYLRRRRQIERQIQSSITISKKNRK